MLGAFLVWNLFSPPPKLIVWIDSIGYLGPAADALERRQFTHWVGRGSGYPAFLWLWLSVDLDPGTLVTAQRLLVVGTFACVAGSLLLTAGLSFRDRTAGAGFSSGLVLFWLGAFALYPPVSGLAHIVMPEVLFSTVLGVILVSLAAHARLAISRWAVVVWAAVSMVSAIALPLIKPHALLVPLVVAPLLIWTGHRAFRWSTLIGVGAGSTIAVAALVIPELRLQARFDERVSTVFGPRSLFCNSADLVYPFLARPEASPAERRMAAALEPILTPGARSQAVLWPLIGFDGDACTYGEPVRVLETIYPGDSRGEAAFYLSTYVKALSHRPEYLLVRLTRHAAEFARKPFNAVSGDYFFRASPEVIERNRHLRPLFDDWFRNHEGFFDGLVESPVRRLVPILRYAFAGTGLFLVATSLGVACLAGIHRSRISRSGQLAIAALVLSVTINAVIAVVHTFEPRYLAMQVPLLIVLGGSASLALAEAFVRRRAAS